LGRWRLPHVRRAGIRNFTQPHFPIGDGTQVYRLRQFHREIGVRILFVDVSQGIAEQNDVKMASCRIFSYPSLYLQAPKSRIPDCNLGSGRDIQEFLV